MSNIKEIVKLNKDIRISYRIAAECCNYLCPYCAGTHLDKPNDNMVIRYIIKYYKNVHSNIQTFIDVLNNQGYLINFEIQGGEPSIIPLNIYEDFVSKIDLTKLNSIFMLTNLSNTVEYFDKLANIFGNKLKIGAAWHAAGKQSLDEFIDKVDKLNKTHDIFIKFTVDDDNFVGEEYCKKIEDKNIKIVFNKIIDKKNALGVQKPITNPYLVNYFNNYRSNESEYKIIYNDDTEKIVKNQYIKNLALNKNNVICIPNSFTISYKGKSKNQKIPYLNAHDCFYVKRKNININPFDFSKKYSFDEINNYVNKFISRPCKKTYKECSEINCKVLKLIYK